MAKIKKPVKKEKYAAIVTIFDAASMSPKGRQNIANWLRRTGSALQKEGAKYDKNFKARYIYF